MVIYTDKSLPTPDIVRCLGERFRDYRISMRMTRKEVSLAAGIGMTTLYKFETGGMADISFRTLQRLLKVIGLESNWRLLLPELPESPYDMTKEGKKIQRVRHKKKQ